MGNPLQSLTPSPNYRQALVALLGLLLGLSIFCGLQRVITPRYSWVTPLDEVIPFIAQSWWAYVLFFPFVLLAAAYVSANAFRAFKNATGIAFGVAILCFWLFPEYVPRPDIGSIDNAFLHQRLSRLWQLDLASNGCPSLHVAVTCLACRALWSRHYKWLTGITGLLICLSTLTLKQHTLIDVAGGVLLALACALATQRQGSNARVPA
ncbi:MULTISPECIES: phosphatase PAP2 family protein [unclassified Pseudomonas]|uniref:phosphatase PAP2 family protein n=1 Tax=unclassified Pseudomonas TaxID=196821 RepID=UPI000CD22251|nr:MULTISPECIES: phosphatase PAP2 family protein [unclassified Pseudomonas]POA28588.1 inositol phosphorylceramide synthase [Pseudomonas sp. GW456-R21]POA63022.1 inositol phosphorylceramide synthase [Pseudomonas sp. GW460-R15]